MTEDVALNLLSVKYLFLVDSELVLTVFCVLIDVQDLWDSIQNNDYFSVEGAKDVIRQVDNTTLISCTVDDLRDVKCQFDV